MAFVCKDPDASREWSELGGVGDEEEDDDGSLEFVPFSLGTRNEGEAGGSGDLVK